MIPNKIFLFIFLLLFTLACSSTKETSKKSGSSAEEVYVFDDVSDVSDVDTTSHEAVEVTVEQKVETTPEPPVSTQPVPVAPVSAIVEDGYIVQVGAFSTRDKAENFINSAKNSISYKLNTKYIEKTGFYAVQLPPFKTRKEAEKVRNKLWNNAQFSDAFIVPKSK
ncbi:MAG: SPOR domain-containing protein [Chlorobi bacterium]|nr:SPOR domain-containing protein [Chlorobiota bacterium]